MPNANWYILLAFINVIDRNANLEKISFLKSNNLWNYKTKKVRKII